MFGILSKALGGLKGLKGVALAVTLAFSAGAGAAIYVKGKWDAADRAKEAERALLIQQEAVRRAIAQGEELRRLDNQILSELADKGAEIRVVERTITKVVSHYVPAETADRDCRLANAVVWMLNDARRGHQGPVPGASEPTDEEARAPSAVTRREEVEAHADCAIRYNEIAHRYSALIDWIEQSRAANATHTDR